MAQHLQSVQPIPGEVQQLAETHSLGAPTASYSKRPFSALFALILLFLLSLFSLGWSILLFFASAPPLWEELGVPILTAFIGGLTILYLAVWKKQQIHIYTEGFVYLRWPKAKALRWEQIETIWYETANMNSNVWDTLRIRTTDGTELRVSVVTLLRDAGEIYRTIERKFVRIRLPGMLEQYEAGNDIAFGELSVNKLGLARKGETLLWSQVQSIDVGDQRVEIKKEGQKWRNWFAGSVPNQSLLRELVAYMRSAP
jgi:hypothetical protein